MNSDVDGLEAADEVILPEMFAGALGVVRDALELAGRHRAGQLGRGARGVIRSHRCYRYRRRYNARNGEQAPAWRFPCIGRVLLDELG